MQLLRRAQGLTQEGLAEALGVSRQSVAKWEAGIALPDPDKLPRLSDSLRVTLDVLNIHHVELWRTQGRPRYWTALTFSCGKIDLPQRLSGALKGGKTPWFCDFRGGNTKYIVLRGRILHYRIGDAAGRERAVQACIEMGIPAHQTNWED